MLTSSTELIAKNILNSLTRKAEDMGIDANDLMVEACPGFHRPWVLTVVLYFKPLQRRKRFDIEWPNGSNSSKNASVINNEITLFLAEIKGVTNHVGDVD